MKSLDVRARGYIRSQRNPSGHIIWFDILLMLLRPHDLFSGSLVCNKVELCYLYSSLLLLPSMCFFFAPYDPFGISFPLGQFQCFHQCDYTIQIEGVSATMFYCGHHLVYVNEHSIHEHAISPRIIEFSWQKCFYVQFSHELYKYVQNDKMQKVK
jgi:hypothetical protein